MKTSSEVIVKVKWDGTCWFSEERLEDIERTEEWRAEKIASLTRRRGTDALSLGFQPTTDPNADDRDHSATRGMVAYPLLAKAETHHNRRDQ